MKLSEKLIYCTTKIISTLNDNTYAIGTGFFMDFNIDNNKGTSQPVIITNKHVVKNAKEIAFSLCKSTEDNIPLDKEKFTITLSKFKIIEHPDDDVDLCAISIGHAKSLIQEHKVHLFPVSFGTDLIITENEINNCSAMEDVIMIGYPNGIEDTCNNKPIIRKGITSTHMKYDYKDKKEFLIDMACFPGSSGSPIFFCNETSYTNGNGVIIGSRCRLLGILYAGPQYTSKGQIIFENISTNPKAVVNIPINLGIVIKACRIKEIEDLMKTMN